MPLYSPDSLTEQQLAEHFDQVEEEYACYGHPITLCRSWASGPVCEECLTAASSRSKEAPYGHCHLCGHHPEHQGRCPFNGTPAEHCPECIPIARRTHEPRGDRTWQNACAHVGMK